MNSRKRLHWSKGTAVAKIMTDVVQMKTIVSIKKGFHKGISEASFMWHFHT